VRILLTISRPPSDVDSVYAYCSCGWSEHLPRTTRHVLAALTGLWRIHLRQDHPDYE
jgi:hypothetical protein